MHIAHSMRYNYINYTYSKCEQNMVSFGKGSWVYPLSPLTSRGSHRPSEHAQHRSHAQLGVVPHGGCWKWGCTSERFPGETERTIWLGNPGGVFPKLHGYVEVFFQCRCFYRGM